MKQPNKSKAGAALLLSMVVVIAVGLFSFGIMHHAGLHSVQTVHLEQSAQAFWEAEAGLKQALSVLAQNGKDYRDGLKEGDVLNLPGTNYTITITSITRGFINDPERDEFSIESRGEIMGIPRVIAQKIIFHPGWDAAIYGKQQQSTIKSNSDIIGRIYQLDGNVQIDSNASVTDGVYVDNGTVTGKGSYQIIDDANIPSPPQLNHTEYTKLFTAPYTNILATINSATITIPDGSYRYLNSATSGIKSIKGAGTLLVNGALSIDLESIGDQVTIIALGNVVTEKKGTIGESVTIYSGKSIETKQQTDTKTGLTLLAKENITLRQSGDFLGIIYAEGNVWLKAASDFQGTIVGGGTITIDSNSTITYNPNVFINPLPDGFEGLDSIVVFSQTWQEIRNSP